MIKPNAPTPFIIHKPPEKEMTWDPDPAVQNAFRAQSKAMNFGLELFKFISPAEIAYMTQDGKAREGYQGFLQNNFAWWMDGQQYFIKNDYLTIDKLKQGDASLENPTDAFVAVQNYHIINPENKAKSFGRVHRSSPLMGAGAYASGLLGRLSNVNPFAGLAGGYTNNGYKNNNTWNRYEITEGNNKTAWDFGMSDGYQSASALDNLSDWGDMNEQLDAISAQVIEMKNKHYGYTWVDNTTNFHDDVSTPFGKTWTTLAGGRLPYTEARGESGTPSYANITTNLGTGLNAQKEVLDSSFDSISTKPFGAKRGESTQAPNYFEIINSGAWSQWKKDQNGAFTVNNLDNKKFYYFLKGMLESKRRGLEAYRHLLGKVEQLPKDIDDSLKNYSAGETGMEGKWENALNVSRKQCRSIKDWYDNVTSKLPAYNSFFNAHLYEMTHGFFNQMQSIGMSNNNSFTDQSEVAGFYIAATQAAYKWMIDSANPNNLTALKNKITQPSLELSKYDYIKTYAEPTTLANLADLIKVDPISIPNNSDKNSFITEAKKITVKLEGLQQWIKLEELAREQAYADYIPPSTTTVDVDGQNVNSQGVKPGKEDYFSTTFGRSLKDLTWKYRKQLLSLYNAMAPIAEFYSNDPTMRVPIADFADYDNTGDSIDQLNFDYVPFSIIGNPDADASYAASSRSYDGYAQFRGFGTSWGGGVRGKKDGVLSVIRMNPVLSNGIEMASFSLKTDLYDDGTLQNYSPNLGISSGVVRTVDPSWSLDKAYREQIYASERGIYYLGNSPGATNRGTMREVDENPAFAGAAYSYDSLNKRREDELLAVILTFNSVADNRIKKAQYEENMDDFDAEERKEAMAEARAAEEARQEERRIEQALAEAARERRAQENRRR